MKKFICRLDCIIYIIVICSIPAFAHAKTEIQGSVNTFITLAQDREFNITETLWETTFYENSFIDLMGFGYMRSHIEINNPDNYILGYTGPSCRIVKAVSLGIGVGVTSTRTRYLDYGIGKSTTPVHMDYGSHLQIALVVKYFHFFDPKRTFLTTTLEFDPFTSAGLEACMDADLYRMPRKWFPPSFSIRIGAYMRSNVDKREKGKEKILVTKNDGVGPKLMIDYKKFSIWGAFLWAITSCGKDFQHDKNGNLYIFYGNQRNYLIGMSYVF